MLTLNTTKRFEEIKAAIQDICEWTKGIYNGLEAKYGYEVISMMDIEKESEKESVVI